MLNNKLLKIVMLFYITSMRYLIIGIPIIVNGLNSDIKF